MRNYPILSSQEDPFSYFHELTGNRIYSNYICRVQVTDIHSCLHEKKDATYELPPWL